MMVVEDVPTTKMKVVKAVVVVMDTTRGCRCKMPSSLHFVAATQTPYRLLSAMPQHRSACQASTSSSPESH
jgi:hypothetical protein